MMAKRWTAVGVYFLIACAISWPLFWLTRHSGLRPPIPQPLLSLGFMWGPGIAALICWRLFKDSSGRGWTVWGGWKFAALFYAVPLVALVAVFLPVVGPKALIILPLAGLFGFLMTLGEELGWRGWLQDALAPIGRWWRYVVIGLLWEVWHMRFGTALFDGGSWSEALRTEVQWLLGAIVISAVIGEAFDRSRALIVAVTLHLWLNLVMSGELAQIVGPHMTLAYGVAVAAVVWWCWLLIRTPEKQG